MIAPLVVTAVSTLVGPVSVHRVPGDLRCDMPFCAVATGKAAIASLDALRSWTGPSTRTVEA